MQPSESEIKREVEALRDIRRRSTNPLTIDPDLPNQSAQVGNSYWTPSSPTDGDSSSENDHSHSSDSNPDTPNNPADDPFRLFWLPASLHPEIAPAEFRAFLNEHARTPPPEDEVPSRSNSISSIASSSMPASLSSSGSLGRKKSMLSRQYKPSVGDGIENAEEVVVKRNRSSIYSVNRNTGPQLTINDLQRLEKLAEEASESDDPARLRSILRRSLSLNVSPSEDDFTTDFADEADVPVIVPPPGQILRRAARTKIRKPGLPGDGGGHRFGASRRGPRSDSGHSSAPSELRDDSSSDHGDSSVEYAPPLPRPRTFSPEDAPPLPRPRTFSLEDPPVIRPESFSEEASIYDAYAHDDYDESDSIQQDGGLMILVPPDIQPHEVDLPLSPAAAPAPVLEASGPVLHQPQPQRLLTPTPIDVQRQKRTPSPDHDPATSSPSHSPPSQRIASPNYESPHQQQMRKEKDKKGLFGKWGADKAGKKGNKDKNHEREKEIRDRAEKEKEKDSGFFGSLFGSKKKPEESSGAGNLSSSTGREAAQALLGASKAYVPSPSPVGSMGNNNGNLSPYARYPIHVERAIYRLSHIKLSNPRRPLYEQVLISNLMFWYLGVINKPTTPDSPPGEEKAPPLTEKQAKEKEQKERDEHRQRAEKERLEREQKEREREKEAEMAQAAKKREQSPSGRRTALTKPNTNGPAGRRAEQPVKGTQYDQQHRVMEQEYVGFNNNNGQSSQSVPRTGSAPPQAYNRSQAMKMQPGDHYYYNSDMQQNQHNLPPGAMLPAGNNDQPWRTPAQSAPIPPMQSSTAHRRSKSPPQQAQNRYNESLQPGNKPSRAHSASAVTAGSLPPANGQLRKGRSAHAVSPKSPTSPDEDVPLAVWQQQRRK